MNKVPPIRIRQVNGKPERTDGDYVLYWMTAFRRTGWNFALQRAVERASALGRPLLILEALRCDYPWASDRLHRFILDGMAANARALKNRPAHYYPFVEREKGQGKGLLSALAGRACLVVTDDFPCFFLPRMTAAAGKKVPGRVRRSSPEERSPQSSCANGRRRKKVSSREMPEPSPHSPSTTALPPSRPREAR
ncbi:MAG: hypothetical protein P8Z70_14235 [Desulfuromonadales bacterium]